MAAHIVEEEIWHLSSICSQPESHPAVNVLRSNISFEACRASREKLGREPLHNGAEFGLLRSRFVNHEALAGDTILAVDHTDGVIGRHVRYVADAVKPAM